MCAGIYAGLWQLHYYSVLVPAAVLGSIKVLSRISDVGAPVRTSSKLATW